MWFSFCVPIFRIRPSSLIPSKKESERRGRKKKKTGKTVEGGDETEGLVVSISQHNI